MGNEPRCPGVDGGQSVEAINEVPQDLRILRQLGDYACKQLIVQNPFFRKFSRGDLGPVERQTLREQLDYLRSHIRQLAIVGIEEAHAGNDVQTAQVLQQITLYLLQDTPRNETTVVHPATLEFLHVLNELSGKKDFIQIAAAMYALLRTAPLERMLSAKLHHPLSVRAGVRNELRSNAAAGVEDEHRDSINVPAALEMLAGADERIEDHLRKNLEEAIKMYVTARYTFREGIMKGIDAVIEAKQKFYQDLSAGIDEQDLPEGLPLNLSADQP